MPLINFLELYAAPIVRQFQPLKKGDMVFHISVEPFRSGLRRWIVRDYCHAGLLANDVDDYQLGDPTQVYHMGERVSRDSWHDSVHGSRIDLVGVVRILDRTTRTELIAKALAYYGRAPKPLHRSCYWMGDAQPTCHIRFPNEGEAYGFSCATFVHQCYQEIGIALVDLESIPLTTQNEVEELVAVFQRAASTKPFKRLFPGYLIGAAKEDQYPFAPQDWEPWKNHGQYIPLHAIRGVGVDP